MLCKISGKECLASCETLPPGSSPLCNVGIRTLAVLHVSNIIDEATLKERANEMSKMLEIDPILFKTAVLTKVFNLRNEN